MIRNFLDRGTAALLTVLPDRHDVIECISTASQFYILEAIKVVLNKPIDHFHLRLLLTLLPCIHSTFASFCVVLPNQSTVETLTIRSVILQLNVLLFNWGNPSKTNNKSHH